MQYMAFIYHDPANPPKSAENALQEVLGSAVVHLGRAGLPRRRSCCCMDSLLRMEPTPVVLLNRAVALAEAGVVLAGLQTVEALSLELCDYQP